MWADKHKHVGAAVLFTCSAVLVVSTTVLQGVVLQSLWRWFLQPLGAPSINIGQALGIALIIGWLTNSYVDDEEHPAAVNMMRSVAVTLIVWALGAVYARFA